MEFVRNTEVIAAASKLTQNQLFDAADSTCTTGYNNDGSTGLEIFENGVELGIEARLNEIYVIYDNDIEDEEADDTAWFFIGTKEEVIGRLIKAANTPKKLNGTSLVITNLLLQQEQTSLFSEETTETLTIYEVEDEITGQKGHVLREVLCYKRDVERDEFYTDNPALFASNHPEICDFNIDAGAPTHTNHNEDVLTQIFQECYEHQLMYREDADTKKYGLYIDESHLG